MKIYRYFKSSKIDQIEKESLYFTPPKFFGDPFDCRITLGVVAGSIFSTPVISIIGNAMAGVLIPGGALAAYLIMKKVRELVDANSVGVKQYEKFSAALSQKVILNLGIVCFSQTYNNIMLWDHYTSGHKGFVIACDTDAPFLKEIGLMQKIRYRSELPDYDILKRNGAYDFFIKHPKYEHEEEFRIIRLLDDCQKEQLGDQTYYFMPMPLTQVDTIYIGAYASNELKARICNLSSVKSANTKVIQCAIGSGQKVLEFIPVT